MKMATMTDMLPATIHTKMTQRKVSCTVCKSKLLAYSLVNSFDKSLPVCQAYDNFLKQMHRKFSSRGDMQYMVQDCSSQHHHHPDSIEQLVQIGPTEHYF
jgi:hypothetical protein